jgi:hypothetical protein
MPSRYCTGNDARHRYRLRKTPGVEIVYLVDSRGWTQRFNPEGLARFDQVCARDAMTYRIVDPVKMNALDEIMIAPAYEG